MKVWKNFINISCLLMFVVGYQSVEAQQNLAQQAYAIFQQSCLDCHGPHGAYTEQLVIQNNQMLIDTGTVVPRNPDASEFYRRLLGPTENGAQMPFGGQALPPAAIETIRRWIAAGAPSWEVQHDVNFIPMDAMLNAIANDLETLEPFDRPFARYFTLTHLYNAGESPETLRAYRIALSKLVNSLSWKREVTQPQPIDLKETIFYIDLRKYDWDRNEAWTQIEQEYPYSTDFDPDTQAGLLEKLTNLREEMKCEEPFVHVDWFLATASLPPLYHDILDLPETDLELERNLDVNVLKNIQNAPGINVWRAGFNESGVSNNNRVVERHTSRYGAYWKSYDFAGNVGAQNVLTHPLNFRHDGGEVVFNLPNGLQAYYISDASGNRIDAAPIQIVRNPAANDPVVHNGLSCIGCHTEGMKTFKDEVRAEISKQPDSPLKAQVLRLYVEKSVMDDLVAQDTQRYRVALEETGGVFGGIEPVHQFFEAFHGPVDAAHAAAAVGLEAETFLKKIRENPSLQRLGLRALEGENGNIKRDAWTSNFAEMVSALNSPDTIEQRPVVPVDDFSPSDLVLIPDINLRTAVEAALGKPPGALITAADMAKLTRLVADDVGISNLTGLEASINLERIEFRRNRISDLSPLRGLTRLNNIKLRGNRIVDVSPLAGLVNVDWLGLEENEITDLSPLKGLIKLNGIGIESNPVSDVSPLAGLISLEGIRAWNTSISDFSSLATAERLKWIEFSGDRLMSELSSLKGLKTLRRLEINHCGISDISGLAQLTQLTSLTLHDNLIVDVSPLKSLKRLTHLNLSDNVIVDVSPLTELDKLKDLDLSNNAIADFSPLKGLTEKIYIKAANNPAALTQGGPKITGPWLWILFPGAQFDTFRTTDLLARASGGDVTEREIATNGTMEGESLGDKVWVSHKISAGENNMLKLLTDLGIPRGNGEDVIYGSLTLYSPREQKTNMFAGSDNNHKVWLNGALVKEKLAEGWAHDYEHFFPVTLKQGKNVLLVAIHCWGGGWAGHFGFSPDAEYTVLTSDPRFSVSTETERIDVGKAFTVHFKAVNIADLAGWQSDITFDSAVLKADRVSEGSFLKQKGGRTHFRRGTINNQTGRINSLSSTRISEGGSDGEGTLLSVTFTAKATGETRVALRNFQAGSSAGEAIPSAAPDIIITVGDPPISGVSDSKFSLSTDVTPVRSGDTFTLHLKTKDVTDLAGWETDIAFDSAVLEAVEVSEGDFLKAEGVSVFFTPGTIDNTIGKITGLSTARFGDGVSGTGTLLSITFTAKTAGETRVTFSRFLAGSSKTEVISSEGPKIIITVEDRAFPAWDVNQDGRVNVLDLISVAQHLGSNASVNRQADVNADGTINVLDLITVAQHLGESSTEAAPSGVAIEDLALDSTMIQAWIARAQVENDGSLAFQQGIANLEQLLALFIPEETALLHNYPNPFNPETWIPYQLAEPAEVVIRIYAASGILIRTLDLGHQPAGIYQYRSRAAYWDGKNEIGESVASGVYFYALTAGDFTGTRKMLIMK